MEAAEAVARAPQHTHSPPLPKSKLREIQYRISIFPFSMPAHYDTRIISKGMNDFAEERSSSRASEPHWPAARATGSPDQPCCLARPCPATALSLVPQPAARALLFQRW